MRGISIHVVATKKYYLWNKLKKGCYRGNKDNADYDKKTKAKKPLSEVFEGKPHLERLLRQNGGNTDNI